MYFFQAALLCSIFMVTSESADYCITGAYTDDDPITAQGQYVATGSSFNGQPTYQLSSVGNGCSGSKYLYIQNGVWYLGPSLGGSYNIKCSETTTLPSDCTSWVQGDNTFENIQVISGSCPEIECSNFQVTGSGLSICNGIFVKQDRNSYVNAAGSITYYFNDINEKWYCSNAGAQTNACSTSGTKVSQKNEEYIAMSDGKSNSVLMSNGNTATFKCGVSTPQPTSPLPTPGPTPTPAPVESVSGGLCVGLPSNYIDNNEIVGQYIPDGNYNGYPRYKSQCNTRYIVYYNSGYGYLIANGNGENVAISTFYGQCNNAAYYGNLPGCDWGIKTVSDQYTECGCSVASAGDMEPISFDNHFASIPIDNNYNNNNNDNYSFFDITTISILTCIFVTICIFGIAICSYGFGFNNGRNASAYKNISGHDDV